jgi:hypothetical protein
MTKTAAILIVTLTALVAQPPHSCAQQAYVITGVQPIYYNYCQKNGEIWLKSRKFQGRDLGVGDDLGICISISNLQSDPAISTLQSATQGLQTVVTNARQEIIKKLMI